MKTRNTFIVLGILLLIIIIIIVAKKDHSQDLVQKNDGAIKIGAILSLTGPGVQDADTVKAGIDFAVADLKKQGADIEVAYEDDGTNPKNTISGLQLLKTKGVQAVIGFTWDFLYNASIPVLDQEKIVGFTATNTSEYTTPGEYGFFMAPKTSYSQPLLEQFFKDNNIKSISFIGSKYSFSDIHFKNLQAAAKNTGVTIVSEDWINIGSEVSAMTAILPKVKSKNPDALFVITGGDEALSALFQRVQQNEIKVPMIAGTTTIGRFLKDHPDMLSPEYPVYSLVPRSSEKFVEYYQKNHDGKTPGEYTEYAYDSVMVLYRAIIDHKDQDLKDYIKASTFKGYVNSYSYDDNHDAKQGMWSLNKVN